MRGGPRRSRARPGRREFDRANNQTTTQTYDVFTRSLVTTYPDGGSTTNTYDTNRITDFRIAAAQLERAPSVAAAEPTTLQLALAAFDVNGVMLNAAVQKADTTSPSAQTQGPRVLTVRERIDVPTDAAWLRFAIRDNSTGRIGATEIALPLALEARR